MKPCDAPLSWETLVAYWAGDLSEPESEVADEHLMGCTVCTETSARVAQMTQAMRDLVPVLLSPEQLETLRGRGMRIEDNPMLPGERREVQFRGEVDLLVHRLQGLDLVDVERLRFSIRDAVSGRLLIEIPHGTFDRMRGEVLVACHKHYVVMPPNTVFELELSLPAGARRSASYTVLHRFG